MMRIEDGMFHEVGLTLKDKCVVGLVPVCRRVIAVGGRAERIFDVHQSTIAIEGGLIEGEKYEDKSKQR
jgi:hypothetical protein